MGEPLPLREPELLSLEGPLWALHGLGAARRGVPAFSAAPSTAWPPVGRRGVSRPLYPLLSPLAVWPVPAPRRPEPRGRPTELRRRFRIGAKQPMVSLGHVSSLKFFQVLFFIPFLTLLLLSVFPVRTEVMFVATRELLRIPQTGLAKPISIPTNLVSLFSRYVDRQKLNLLETKLQ